MSTSLPFNRKGKAFKNQQYNHFKISQAKTWGYEEDDGTECEYGDTNSDLPIWHTLSIKCMKLRAKYFFLTDVLVLGFILD